MVLKKGERGRKGLSKKKGEVGPIIKEDSLSMNYFVFGFLIKKTKEKYNGVLTPRFIGKNCFQVMELLTFFGKRIFISFALPKHTPNGKSYNVCACRCMCRCTSL